MTARLWLAFIVFVALTFIALELYALRTGTPTLSQVVWALNDRIHWVGYPITFGVGFVGGHWFWGRK